jgi:hypothetical protein
MAIVIWSYLSYAMFAKGAICVTDAKGEVT